MKFSGQGTGGALKQLFFTFLEAVLPATCLHCGALYRLQKRTGTDSQSFSGEFQTSFAQLMKEYICDRCVGQFSNPKSPMCIHCGMPFASPSGVDHACHQCESNPNQYDCARASGIYASVMRSLIHWYKYDGCIQLAVPLGRLLWHTLLNYWDPANIDCIIPVPLHPVRLRQRGFNQAGLLVRHWPVYAHQRGLRPNGNWIAEKALVRRRNTRAQTGLTKEYRIANLDRAFEINEVDSLMHQRILIVDDVLTTGATVNACARILKSAGVQSVKVLTLARAM